MMLGGLNPMGEVPVSFGQPQTFSTGAKQSVINPVAPVVPSSDAPQGDDYMTMVKKYAPYVIGAVVLYYLILKNK